MNVEPVEILLVEDDPNDVELALRALNRHNLANRIHVARDGVEALEYLGLREPSPSAIIELPKLVLLDLKLPRIDGLEVLRRIKASESTRMIPVVVLTSSAEERDLVASYALGVNSYIVKPVDFESFMDAVAEVGFYWLLINKFPS
jgi:two-component system response regulator